MTGRFSFHYTWIFAMIIMSYAVLGQNGSILDNPGYTVTKKLLSIEDGLASHEVFCGIQDKAGFLWFGTRNGLNRYDGKNALLFTHQRQKLQDNKVVQLAKDDANHLFIVYGSPGFKLTTNGKIDVMDATTHEVKTLTETFPQLPFKERDVYWLSNDGSDEISFLTAHPFRLWKYSSKKGFRLRYEMKNWDALNISSDLDYRSTGPFCMFGKGKALLKIFNQATQYLVTNDTVTAFTQKNAQRSFPIGFNHRGDLLFTYTTTTVWRHFSIGMVTNSGDPVFPAPAQGQYMDSLQQKNWSQAVNATGGASCIFYQGGDGLYLWKDNAFFKVVPKSELKAFENLTLYQLFSDNLGNLWLCTSNGVLQLTIKPNQFKQYFTIKQQQVETNNQARGIYSDKTGRVSANIWSHVFSNQAGKTQSTGDAEIKYAFIPHNSVYYVGGYNLFRYDDLENKATIIPGGQGSEIWSMFSLNDSLLLLGRSGGLSLYNSSSGKFDSITYAHKNTPEAKFVYRFFKSREGKVWAVAENGLYNIKIDHRRLTIDSHQSQMVNRQNSFLSTLSLLDAYEDAQGIFWLATNGEGLYRWDRKANSFQNFNITSGFPSDVLYRIEKGNDGNLWISSDYGLVRFNPETFSVNTYTTADGISNNEFNRTSSFKAEDGRLFFGGLDGVNAFYPEDFKADTNSLEIPVRIIAFNQFVSAQNGLVNKTTELLDTSQIVLEPDDKFFTLEFQLLDFAKGEVHRYAYKIDGVDKDWNYLSENSIRISGLPYGKFTLHVKAQNQEGAWSKSELVILLVVLKPFYFQWWFIVLCILLFGAVLYLLIHLRLKRLAIDKRNLEQTVNERTAQLKNSLAEKSDLLLEKDVLMKEIHHRVKNNLQVISGLLELQSKAMQDETAKDALREGRNRVRSIALIHQNLYQFEDLSSIDLKRFATELCRQIESVFQKQRPVTTNISVPDLHLDIDTAVPLGLIMNELLSNSFKYAFNDVDSGEINLAIHSVAEGRYELRYRDNGPGLPADFDVSKAVTLGIQLIYDLSRQIGGHVKYENRNGASFTIHFTNREVRKNED